MVEFLLKVHEKQGTAYIPKEIREEFGLRLKLQPNAEAGALYSEGADLRRVIESLKLIIQVLELRAGSPKQL